MTPARPRTRVLSALLVLVLAGAAILLARAWQVRGERTGAPEFPDVVETLELVLDVREPPRVSFTAILELRDDPGASFAFVLNRALEIESMRGDQERELGWTDLGPLRSEYFKEARGLSVALDRPTRTVHITGSGRGLDGSEGRDWMGILLAASDEIRMSVQTAFYPQIPLGLDGPSVQAWPTRMRVLAPDGFEVHAPGTPSESRPASQGGRELTFDVERGGVLSLFAAPRSRFEVGAGDALVTLLLTSDHAALGPMIAEEVKRILELHSAAWGPLEGVRLGIVETIGRGASNEWASYGTVAIERREFSRGVPVELLAHELAHLWWDHARGRGERFLTEGLAEYASWRHAKPSTDGSAGRARAIAARATWWDAAHEHAEDPAVLDVRFSSKGYQAFAYAKGPAALWELQERIGPQTMDALLRDYRARMEPGAEDGAERFLAAVREHAPAESATSLAELFTGAGHEHLELSDMQFHGTRVRARLTRATCHAGVRAPASLPCTLVAHTAEERLVREITLTEPGGSAIEWSAPSEILCVELRAHGLRTLEPVITHTSPALRMVSSEPADGAIDVALGRVLFRLRFGEPIGELPVSLGSAIESASRASNSALRVHVTRLADDDRVLEIEFDGTWPGREHVLVVPEGLTTRAGIPVGAAQVRFRVRSAGDAHVPRVESTAPASGAKDVPTNLQRIEVRFSEPMRAGHGFRKSKIRALEARGWRLPPTRGGRWLDDRTFVLDVERELEPGQRYGLAIDDSFASVLGVHPDSVELLFETRARGAKR